MAFRVMLGGQISSTAYLAKKKEKEPEKFKFLLTYL
jgi:hypothetical protein